MTPTAPSELFSVAARCRGPENVAFSGLWGPLFAKHALIRRDQLNSRFHGRDIFREIGLLP